MGLHTGIAFARDGDYVALALHQAARIAGTGNGGQVVASGAAVAEAGPVPGVRDERLGAFRLRDFDEPVELFQLTADDEEAARFPPLRAVPADGHNLEQPGDAIVGRADELGSRGGDGRAEPRRDALRTWWRRQDPPGSRVRAGHRRALAARGLDGRPVHGATGPSGGHGGERRAGARAAPTIPTTRWSPTSATTRSS